MWAESGNSAYPSSTVTSFVVKGGGEIPQAAEMNAVLWPLPQVLDSLVLL
jgi:hypothetical protein